MWRLLFILALPVMAQECVKNIDDATFCRTGIDFWPITGSTNAWDLYHNGVFQSTEVGGNASIDYVQATPKRQIKVGICDSDHGIALDCILTNVCAGSLLVHTAADSAGIRDCVSDGCNVVVCPFFTTVQGQPLNDLSNACWEAIQAGIILVCSVPNAEQSIDTTPAYPASFNIPNLIPVTSSTRQDTVYSPAATGSNVIAAPGRVILTQDTNGNPVYASGTSYAAPIVSGICAWLLGQFDQSPATIVQSTRQGSVPIDSRIVGRVSLRGAVEALRPVMTLDGPVGIGAYSTEWSSNLVDWSESEILDGQRFMRARVL